ncbi:hypothetical protein H5410_033461, partial [Solanum commersonii]
MFGTNRKREKKTTTTMHNIEECGDKATKLSVKDENYFNKRANYKSRRKLATRKHEDSKRTCTIKDYGKELVGTRIKVWWPLDEKTMDLTFKAMLFHLLLNHDNENLSVCSLHIPNGILTAIPNAPITNIFENNGCGRIVFTKTVFARAALTATTAGGHLSFIPG